MAPPSILGSQGLGPPVRLLLSFIPGLHPITGLALGHLNLPPFPELSLTTHLPFSHGQSREMTSRNSNKYTFPWKIFRIV